MNLLSQIRLARDCYSELLELYFVVSSAKSRGEIDDFESDKLTALIDYYIAVLECDSIKNRLKNLYKVSV